MVFDEAHNLSSALSEIHSPRVTRDMLALSLRQLEAYHARYADRLSSLSHSFLIHLQTVLRALLAVLTSPPPALGRVSVLRTDAFLRLLRVEDINLFDLLRFVAAKRILFKLNGFVDRMRGEESGGGGKGEVRLAGRVKVEGKVEMKVEGKERLAGKGRVRDSHPYPTSPRFWHSSER